MFTDFRLKVLHFIKKNSKIIFIVICIWIIVFFINTVLKNYEPKKDLQTTFKPHTSVMKDTSSVPKTVSNPIEDMIEEYTGYCFEGNIQAAYDMISDICKEYVFHNSVNEFTEYVVEKTNGSKKYAIQDFSNDGNTYIYQIKYSDDMLATGLTNTTYHYSEEKMIFKKKRDGSIEMAVGNFVDYGEIKNISENEYLKVDVKSVIKYYDWEQYTVKLTNRSDYTIVISDNQSDNEVFLSLDSGDARNRMNIENPIVLKPNQSKTVQLGFQKYYDNNDDAKSITFGAIRVMENYSGTNVEDTVIQSEIQNAIAKFSVNIPVTYDD